MSRRRYFFAFCVLAFSLTATAAFAQSGGPGNQQDNKPNAEKTAKESQKKIDEIAEAARVLVGAAGNPE